MEQKSRKANPKKSAKLSTISALIIGRKLELWAVLTVLSLLTLLTILVLGLIYIWQLGWVLWFSLLGLALSLTGIFIRLKSAKAPINEEQNIALPTLQASSDWTPAEHKIWKLALANIQSKQLDLVAWTEIPPTLLEQLSFIAHCYHHRNADADYAFSLPELLLLCETVSHDYRSFILENIPLSQSLKLSTLHKLYRRRSSLNKTYKASSYAYRLLRLTGNPVTAIVNEFRNRFSDSLIHGFGDQMQIYLKQTLLEEVSLAGINLYSGRLKLSSAELASYQQNIPRAQEFSKVRPLTVVLLGQTNAGKSSLVNALKNGTVAEVDIIPATDGFNCHRCLINDELEVDLIDTPGIDGNATTADNLLERAIEADLLLWLCQANQSAKKLDRDLIDRWNAYFSSNPNRRPPPLILITTHNDRLSPTGQWDPPYDLTESSDTKANNILEALRYNIQVMGLAEDSASIPIALPPGKTEFNIETLRTLLGDLAADASSSQRNRDRLQASDVGPSITRTWQQCLRLGKVVGKTVKLSVRKNQTNNSD